MNKLTYISTLIILLYANSIFGLNNDIHKQLIFKNINIDTDLSIDKINAIIQDSNQNTWIATEDGIYKFNGYNIKRYPTHKTDSNKIEKTGRVFQIKFDSHNTMWASTRKGLLYFDEDNDIFVLKDIKYKQPLFDFSISNNDIIYILSMHNVISYNIKKDSSCIIDWSSSYSEDLSDIYIEKILIDNKNNLWLGLYNFGVVKYNIQTNNITYYKYNKTNHTGIVDKRITSIYKDNTNAIWFGGYSNGICLFNYENDNFTQFTNTKDKIKVVNGIVKDKNNNYWIGTRDGLFLFDVQKNQFIKYADSHHPVSVLESNFVSHLYIGKQDNLWIGTFMGGISYSNLINNNFTHYRYSRIDNPYFLNQKDVNTIALDNNNDIWIGLESGGLAHLNRQSGKYNYYIENTNNKNCLQSNIVKDIQFTPEGNAWIGTYNGLSFFNKEKNSFTTTFTNSKKIKGLLENHIYQLLYDSNKNLWIETATKIQLLRYNSDTILSININPKSLRKWILDLNEIAEDNNGDIWVTSKSGLFKINSKTLEHTLFNKHKGLDIKNVNYIHKDSKGKLWFNIGIGKLICLNPNNWEYTVFDKTKNMPNIDFKTFFDDKNGNIWASTNNGIYKFINIINNKDTVIYKSYNTNDGLQNKLFYRSSGCSGNDNEFYFGGINGFNSFNPNKIKTNPYPPTIEFTEIKANNKIVNINDTIEGNIILTKSITKTDKIKLNHKIKTISISFVAIHYNTPKNNIYRYKMEGIDEDWITANGNNYTATYSTLTPKEYTFKVQVANRDKVWNKNTLKLKIEVVPPWWKTKIFILFITILIVLLLILAYKLKVKILKKYQKHLESVIEARTKDLQDLNSELEEGREEIRSKNEELLKHKSELEDTVKKRTTELEKAKIKAEESDRLKSAFLANISHEIRTPLNAIVGFSSLFANPDLSQKDIEEYITIIEKNSNSLTVLINDILDISKIEVGQLDLIISDFNVNEILSDLEMYYRYREDNENVSIIFINKNSSKLIINNAPERFKQIVINLINNAIKFTDKGFIKFGYEKRDNDILFYVHDSGTGIPPENINNIFKYFQKYNTNNKNHRGTGLGLSISKQLIEIMGGKIWAESEEGIGTKILFTLPYKYKKH